MSNKKDSDVWVERLVCGCAIGVVNAEVAPTVSAAWREFYPRVRERDKAMDAGITFERVSWQHYRENVELSKCPHAAVRDAD